MKLLGKVEKCAGFRHALSNWSHDTPPVCDQCSQPSRPDPRALASYSPVRPVRVGKDGHPRRPSFIKAAVLWVGGWACRLFFRNGNFQVSSVGPRQLPIGPYRYFAH